VSVAITCGASLLLALVTLALALSHNRPFDVFTGRSERRWWSCQFGVDAEPHR
jgi:hypothetical protein